MRVVGGIGGSKKGGKGGFFVFCKMNGGREGGGI